MIFSRSTLQSLTRILLSVSARNVKSESRKAQGHVHLPVKQLTTDVICMQILST